jgi:hypothetical protein
MRPYVKPVRVPLRGHPEYSEKWVQARIREDPSILGLGELVLLHEERVQPSGGRLDLLLQDPETKRRYEVELQLGATDETHIIRTLEYWDIERKRYPQYDHCAVLVAEDIVSRFLNVVSLFNGTIPLIAIQMQAYAIGDNLTLVFTTVMDELSRGLVDDDETAEATPTDRAFWAAKGAAALAIVDDLLGLVTEIDAGLNLKYNKFYIGLVKNDKPNNFIVFRLRKHSCLFQPRLEKSSEIDEMLARAEVETLPYDKAWSRYRIYVTSDDIKRHAALLRDLMKRAWERQGGA